MLESLLVVDGDAAQCNVLEQVISEKLNYNVLSVPSGDEAVNLVISAYSEVELMLLDMQFAQIDILHTVRRIRQHRADLQIIILTEYGDHARAAEVIKAGANDFLVKPVSVERLRLSIASALRIQNLCRMVENLERLLVIRGDAGVCGDFSASTEMLPLVHDGKVRKLSVLEEDIILFALKSCGGSMSKAARGLGIGRSTLYRKVSEMERHRNRLPHKLISASNLLAMKSTQNEHV